MLKLGQPTVVRHMKRLEQSVGTRLFERTKDGHRLTRSGEELLPLAQGMADTATAIDRRRAGLADGGGGIVRVASGVRHGLPARGDLIRVSLGSMSAAIYGATSLVEKHPAAKTDARWRACPWVAYDTPHEYFRTMAWLAERLGDRRPRVRASRFILQLEAIRAGAGLGILPCFLADSDPDLVRLTPPIDDLAAGISGCSSTAIFGMSRACDG